MKIEKPQSETDSNKATESRPPRTAAAESRTNKADES